MRFQISPEGAGCTLQLAEVDARDNVLALHSVTVPASGVGRFPWKAHMKCVAFLQDPDSLRIIGAAVVLPRMPSPVSLEQRHGS